jgi:hypothetical protein
MPIDRDQILMGYAIAIVCLVGLAYSRWFLNSTRKGRWILIKLGPANGLMALRVVFLAGAAVGICLALDVIRPL